VAVKALVAFTSDELILLPY